MEANLATTNLLLGIMAAVSVFEALLLIGTGIALFMVYRRVMELVNAIDQQRLAPAMARVNAILDDVPSAMGRVNAILDDVKEMTEDVKDVTAKVRHEVVRVDEAIGSTIDRVDDTVDRVRWNVRSKATRVIGLFRGLRVMMNYMLHADARADMDPSARGAGPVM